MAPPEAAAACVLADAAPSVLTAVVAVDILEALRDTLGLEVVLRDSRVDSVRWGGGAA